MQRRSFLQALGAFATLLPSGVAWASPTDRDAALRVVTSAEFRTWSGKITTLYSSLRTGTDRPRKLSDLLRFTAMERRSTDQQPVVRYGPDGPTDLDEHGAARMGFVQIPGPLRDEDGFAYPRTEAQWDEVSEMLLHGYVEPALAEAGVVLVSEALHAVATHPALEPVPSLPDRDLLLLRRAADPSRPDSWTRIVVTCFGHAGAGLDGWKAPKPDVRIHRPEEWSYSDNPAARHHEDGDEELAQKQLASFREAARRR